MDKRVLAFILTPERVEGWKESGVVYGYPWCCVQEFTTTTCWDTKEKYPDGPWSGTGFVPCLPCAEKCLVNFTQFVAEQITPNRLFPWPFPKDEEDIPSE